MSYVVSEREGEVHFSKSDYKGLVKAIMNESDADFASRMRTSLEDGRSPISADTPVEEFPLTVESEAQLAQIGEEIDSAAARNLGRIKRLGRRDTRT